MRYQRDRPVLTHSFPTRRSSDLEGGVRSIGGKYAGWVRLRRRHRRRPATTSDSNANVTAKKAGSACGPNLAIASPASAGPRAAPTPLNSSRLLHPARRSSGGRGASKCATQNGTTEIGRETRRERVCRNE